MRVSRSARSRDRRAPASGSISASASVVEESGFIIFPARFWERAREINSGHAGMQLTRRYFGHYHHEGAARSGSSLRAPDETLESAHEGIHLRRAERHLHH